MNYKLNPKPTHDQLNKIETWLVEEHNKYNKGFYCNWNVITTSFDRERIITFDIDDFPIGFLVWRPQEISVKLEIIEIHPDYRNKGLGTVFQNQIEDYFRKTGIEALTLECSPPDSETFVRRQEFIQFPKCGLGDRRLSFFKPLIKTEKLAKNNLSSNKIELWNQELLSQRDISTNWTWNIKVNENGELLNPIIFPCHYDWTLRITIADNVIFNDRVKSFDKSEAYQSPFMYITKIL